MGKETTSIEGKKSASPDDVVLLEIDVKEPSKRSPVSASAVYGASPSQYIIRHGDDAQEVRKRKIMVSHARTTFFSIFIFPFFSRSDSRFSFLGLFVQHIVIIGLDILGEVLRYNATTFRIS